jgi:heat shock protein HslJ
MVFVQAGQAASEISAQGALDRETLANLTYRSEWTASGEAPLVDGLYSEPAAPGSAIELSISLGEHLAFDRARERAAAILIASPGGSGTFYELALVEADGVPEHVASVTLGDRVLIQSLAFDGDEIVVEMVAHGAEDPMCCPTQSVRVRNALREGALVEVSREVLDREVGSETDSPLIGQAWTWHRFLSGDSGTIEVDDPDRYTLTLDPDGTYRVEADCNLSGGAYTLSEGGLVLEPGPTTLAACGPDSLSDRYLTLLGHVRTYVLEGEQLYLDLWADGGQMVFQPAE